MHSVAEIQALTAVVSMARDIKRIADALEALAEKEEEDAHQG